MIFIGIAPILATDSHQSVPKIMGKEVAAFSCVASITLTICIFFSLELFSLLDNVQLIRLAFEPSAQLSHRIRN